ncbi:MAG: PadR family transcriptional regulator [Defluviitaleaceae bacterium]|nr:PadR family transcriptional regulator [Defluviitaleaceae bacterium]
MEDFILGLLMVSRLTAYQIHIAIKTNYEGICSSSIGNIQRALKKLHEKGYVNLDEVQEGKVLKKIFSITAEGRKRFMEWLSEPLDLLKVKNMEHGRLLLMGFLSKEKQMENIDITIAKYKEAYKYMKSIEENYKKLSKEEMANIIYKQYEDNKEEIDQTISFIEKEDHIDLFENLSKYSIATLKLGIDEIEFTLKWFENFKKELEKEMK